MKINGHVSKDALDILESQYHQAIQGWGDQTAPVDVFNCVSDSHEENAQKLVESLHPDRQHCYHFVQETQTDGAEATIAVTGNGPKSEVNAMFIANCFIHMRDILRTCRAALEHECGPETADAPIEAGA